MKHFIIPLLITGAVYTTQHLGAQNLCEQIQQVAGESAQHYESFWGELFKEDTYTNHYKCMVIPANCISSEIEVSKEKKYSSLKYHFYKGSDAGKAQEVFEVMKTAMAICEFEGYKVDSELSKESKEAGYFDVYHVHQPDVAGAHYHHIDLELYQFPFSFFEESDYEVMITIRGYKTKL